jgi:hypothetical protein
MLKRTGATVNHGGGCGGAAAVVPAGLRAAWRAPIPCGLRDGHQAMADGRLMATPNYQNPTTNHSQVPIPNSQYFQLGELGVGSWEWLGIGSWELEV